MIIIVTFAAVGRLPDFDNLVFQHFAARQMKARYGEALSESIGWHRQQMMEMGERAWPNGLFEMRPCVVERVGPEEAIAYALVGREGWCGHLKGRVRAQWHFARLRGGAFRVDAQKADAA